MNKGVKALLIAAGSIIGLGVLGGVTGMFQLYSCPTPSNEPTFKMGSKFFATNLIKPRRFDFICYKGVSLETNEPEVYFHRLCGMPGDIVEIRDGDLYVNNVNADTKLTLKHMFKISNKDVGSIPQEFMNDESVYMGGQDTDSGLFCLEDKWVAANKLKATRQMFSDNNNMITKQFSQPWTFDNFGPIKVPADSYFVLGDNRHNSLDSRFTGFVNKENVKCTVLWKN